MNSFREITPCIFQEAHEAKGYLKIYYEIMAFFKSYFRYIKKIFSKYSQNELSTPYLHLNKLKF